MKRKILICTPTYRGDVRAEYTRSLLNLKEELQKTDIDHDFCIEICTVLHAARNMMASLVVQSPDLSHLLFVDADIAFEPEAVLKLIDADQEVIGCAYPHRKLPMLEQLGDVPEKESLQEWLSRHMGYSIRTAQKEVTNGIIEVSHIGCGLLLIAKKALNKLVNSVTKYDFDGEVTWFSRGNYYGFFDYMQIDNVSVRRTTPSASVGGMSAEKFTL